jgi:hypothetical protein
MVFGMHRCVHICPAHAGAWLRGTHLSAWQHTAGTQSPSFVHAGAGAGGADDATGAPPDASADGRAQLPHPSSTTEAKPNQTKRLRPARMPDPTPSRICKHHETHRPDGWLRGRLIRSWRQAAKPPRYAPEEFCIFGIRGQFSSGHNPQQNSGGEILAAWRLGAMTGEGYRGRSGCEAKRVRSRR